ncbi:hypothetical protein DL93DRAFT_2100149 [Clavulina sp. PMI_390]|nr:hypothetical protein DL93DRAFT_2100149 [Clavulina sp. PMI_390]
MGKSNRSSTILHIPVELLSEILLILVETYPIVDRNSVLPLLGSCFAHDKLPKVDSATSLALSNPPYQSKFDGTAAERHAASKKLRHASLNPPSSPPPPTLLFEPRNNARLQHLRIVSIWTPFSIDNISSQALQNLTYCPPSATPYTDPVMEWLEKAPVLKECIVTASTVPLGKPADLPDLRFLRITTVDPFKIFCAANLVRLDWTIPPLGISTDTDLVQAGRELLNLRHLSISSLALGELALVLPFIREVTELVHLRVYKWVWTDVLGIIEALTIREREIIETPSSSSLPQVAHHPDNSSLSRSELLPSLRRFEMIDVRNNGPMRVWISDNSMDSLLQQEPASSAFKNLRLVRPTLCTHIQRKHLDEVEVHEADIGEIEREYTSLDRRVAKMSPYPSNQFDWITPTNRDQYLSVLLT